MKGVDCEAETIKPGLFLSFIAFVLPSTKRIYSSCHCLATKETG